MLIRSGVPPDPGELDRRVVIQYRSDGATESGLPVDDWETTPAVTVPMGRRAMAGRERVETAQISARQETRWVMHYRADMDPDLVEVPADRRLLVAGRIHNIQAAQVYERKAWIELVTLAKAG